MTGADGIVMTGADAMLPDAIRPPSTGLRSVDPELALQLTQMTDDSTVNAVVVYHRMPSDSDLADLTRHWNSRWDTFSRLTHDHDYRHSGSDYGYF